MATKKKKTSTKKPSTKKSPAKKRRLTKEEERKRKVITTIGLVLAYIFTTILLFLSFYSTLLSTPGTVIMYMFRGIFGTSAYLFPFAMVFGFFYYFKKKKQGGGYMKLYLLGGILLSISVLFELFAFKK